jgi:hypothetical protein
MDNTESLDKLYEFMKGNGYYGLLAGIILVPIGTNFWAYKSPAKNLYYLNIFIALLLLGISIYTFYQYQKAKSDIKAFIITFAGEENEEFLKMAYAIFDSEIGNRCIALGVISLLFALVTLYWNISKLRSIPSV